MKSINFFYLVFHLPVSLCYFFHLAYSRVSNTKKVAITTTTTTTTTSLSPPSSPSSTPLEVIIQQQSDKNTATLESDQIDESIVYSNGTAKANRNSNGNNNNNNYDRSSLRYCVHRTWVNTKNLASLRVSVRDYKRFRWSLFLMHCMVGITIIVLPTAPPRMLPEEVIDNIY